MIFIRQALACLVALTSIIEARPAPPTHVIHEKRHESMQTWIKRERVAGDAILPIKIGLKQQNLDKGYDWLMDVSDPASPNYSKHWTFDQVTEAFAPSNETLVAVTTWLYQAGIAPERVKQSINKGWVVFLAHAWEAESLFYAEFYAYEHVNGKLLVGCDEYHVPKNIREHIDYLGHGIKSVKASKLEKRSLSRRGAKPYSSVVKPRKRSSSHQGFGQRPNTKSTNCSLFTTPACIAALYQIPESSHVPNPGNAIGIFEHIDTYAQEDLNLFFANFTPSIPNGTHPKVDSINGATAPVAVEDAGGESELDFQLAYPIVYPIEVVLYQDDTGYVESILNALDGSYGAFDALNDTGIVPAIKPLNPVSSKLTSAYKRPLNDGTYKPTPVISISYGNPEVPYSIHYDKRRCNEFMKLGLQGVSVLVSSGDSGVAGREGSGVFGREGSDDCFGPNKTVFKPNFYGNCPYVTSVGATTIAWGNHSLETAAWDYWYNKDNDSMLYTSGGGFSNIYGSPAYQAAAVARYFGIAKPRYKSSETLDGFEPSKAGPGQYNRIGRGIPDVAALGQDIGIYVKGKLSTDEMGTSASCPIFASVITRINDARMNMGKTPVGFINPVLYANPHVLNDITNGSNPGCGTEGFNASVGWDPVTGLGSPNYPKMEKLFLSLP